MGYLNEAGKVIAVIGSRTFDDKERLFRILDKNKGKIKMVSSGGCRGADLLAQDWCQQNGVPCIVYYPRWKDENGGFRRSGGFERNYAIINSSEFVIAFHDGSSRGTLNSLKIAKELNKPTKVFLFTPPSKEAKLEETPPPVDDFPEIIHDDPKSLLEPTEFEKEVL